MTDVVFLVSFCCLLAVFGVWQVWEELRRPVLTDDEETET
jgi:hypothetical protein